MVGGVCQDFACHLNFLSLAIPQLDYTIPDACTRGGRASWNIFCDQLKEPLNNPYKTRRARGQVLKSLVFGAPWPGYLNQRTYGISLSDTNSLRSLQLHTQNPVCGHRNCTISCLPWGIWPHLSESVCLFIWSVSQALGSRGLWNSGNVLNHVCMYMHMHIAV